MKRKVYSLLMIVLATCLMSMSAYGQKSMPYMEGFEGMSSTANLTADGWSNYVPTGSASIDISTSTVYAGSKSLYINNYNLGSNTDYQVVILPEITGTLSTARIKFWSKRSSGTGTIEIGYVTSANDGSTFVSLTSQAHQTTWTYYCYNLNSIPETAARLALKVANYWYNYLDELVVEQQPSCADLATGNILTVSDITATSATITLTDESATDWQVACVPTGSDISSVTPVLVQGSLTTTLTGLSDATNYQVYARRYCSATEVGAWSSAASFATQCLIAESPLFMETFESGTMNLCWSLAYLQNPSNKTTNIVTVASTSSAHNSNYALQFAYASARTIQTVTTQQLPIDSANKYEVVFWMKRHSDASYPNEGIKVWASPMANDTTNATLLGHIHNYYASAPAELESGYYKYYMPITVSGNYYIVFECISDYGAYVYLDDIQVRKIPTCTDIHGSVTASGFTSSSAILSITDSTVTNWDIAYGVQGTNRDSCTIVTATGLSYNLTGLDDDTYYDIYIRRNCGNEVGEWTATPETFRTLCLPVSTYPFVEDFEDHTSGQRLGGCYTTINQDIETGEAYESYYLFSVLTSSPSTYNHTEGGSKYAGLAYSSTSTSCTTTSSYEVKGIRQFQLDQSKFYEVSFWAHRYSSYNCITGVVLGQDITFDSLAFVGEHAITTGDWVQIVEYFQVPTTGVYWMGVGAKPYNGNYSLTFDDFSVRELTCIPPTGIKVDKIKHNSANIIFTTNAPTSCLIVDTVKANIEAGNGTVYSNDNVTASPITIPGLSAETTYYYALRTINGTDTSVWTMPASFTTTCVPETALPFVEDFEDYEPDVVSGCWRFETTGSYYLKYLSGATYNNTEDGSMGISTTSSATSTSASSSSNPFGLYRRFSLTANSNYKVTVFAKKYSSSYSDYGFNLSLVYSDNATGFDGTSMTTASTVRVSTTSWEEYNMYFTAPTTDDYWLGFQMENNGSSYYVYLDDITIEEVAIIPPTNVTVSNVAQTTATMNIESNSNMWQIVIDTIAEEVTYGRIYDNVVTTSTVNLTNLVSGTTLYYAVRSINGTDTSDWSITQSFNTMCYTTVPPFEDDFEDGLYSNVLAGCYWQGGIFEEGEDQFEFRFLDDFVNSGDLSIISTMRGDTYRGSLIGTIYAYRQFALEAGKTYEVSLWGRADASTSWGDYSFNMDLFYGTIQDYDSMTVIATRNINGGIWMQNRAYLTVPATGDYFIGFNATNAGTGSYVHMDDFSVREVTCVPPVNASVTAVSPTSVTFDMGATATKYEVAIDTVEIDLSYEVATSVYQDTVFSSTPTITGLISGKNYNYVIRTICGEGDTSDWTEAKTFSLPCYPNTLPYFEDFESYNPADLPMIVEDCITTEGQQWGVFNSSNYNHTPNGANGMATAKLNTSYSGTSIQASMFKGTAAQYRYYTLESNKTYEYSIYTKSSSNVRDFYFRILMGSVADAENMTELLLDSVCQTVNWFNMKATFTVPESGDYFVGFQTQTLGGAAGYTPYVDDIAFYEVVNEEYYDTICFGSDYAGHGLNVVASDLDEGTNVFTSSTLDSIAGVMTYTKVNLFVLNEVLPSTEDMMICAGYAYTWHSRTLTEAGVYTDTIENQNGCDSICTLNLYVMSTIERFDTVTYCQNQLLGSPYTEPGVYDVVDSLVAVGGCDSIVHTNITINPAYIFTADTTIKQGESIEWHDQTITVAGTYTDSYTTDSGCDSIYVLNVTVISDVENISMVNISVVPNPVKAGATTMVYSNADNIEHVEILNNLGQVITTFVPQSNPIEVRGIEVSGIYFVRVVTTAGDAYVEKLIVK